MRKYLIIISVFILCLFFAKQTVAQGIMGNWTTASSDGFTPRLGHGAAVVNGKTRNAHHNLKQARKVANKTLVAKTTLCSRAPQLCILARAMGQAAGKEQCHLSSDIFCVDSG